MKKNQVAKAIKRVLEKREAVSLIGVGTIMLDNLSAKIIRKGKAITPPKALLTLYDTQTSNEPLKKHLVKKLGLTKKQANKAIDSYSESIVNKLLNYGDAKIDGVTYISQKGGRLELKPIKSFVKRYYEDLPIVPIKKIKKGKRTDPPAQITKPTPIPKVKEASPIVVKTPELKPIKPLNPPSTKMPAVNKISNEPSKAPVVLPITTKLENLTSKPSIKAELPKVVAAKPIPKKEPTMSINERLASSKEKLASSTPAKKSNQLGNTASSFSYTPPKDEGIGCLGPSLSILGLLLVFFFLWKGCNYVYENAPKGKAITTAIDSTAQNIVDTTAETIDSLSSEVKTISGDSKSIPDACVIIAGVFSDSRNTRRMENKILAAGYKLYKEQHKGMTRIGFTFDCGEEDLPAYLLDIRRKIEPFAWYLVPDLYVEYE